MLGRNVCLPHSIPANKFLNLYKSMNNLFICAGHSDTDSGAVYHNTTEARQAREVRDEVIDFLSLRFPKCLKDDDSLNLKETINWINQNCSKDDLAIDIHFNASANHSAQGVEGYAYSTNASMGGLAREIVSKISNYCGMKDRGLKYNDKLGFLKDTKCNAILLECGFLSNLEDAQTILDPVRDGLIAKAISDTIITHYAPQNATQSVTEHYTEDELKTKILKWYNEGHDLMKKL